MVQSAIKWGPASYKTCNNSSICLLVPPAPAPATSGSGSCYIRHRLRLRLRLLLPPAVAEQLYMGWRRCPGPLLSRSYRTPQNERRPLLLLRLKEKLMFYDVSSVVQASENNMNPWECRCVSMSST